MSKLSEDRRIDPRIKAMFGAMDTVPQPTTASRDELLAIMNSPEAQAGNAARHRPLRRPRHQYRHLRVGT